jgi:hypothetical protein
VLYMSGKVAQMMLHCTCLPASCEALKGTTSHHDLSPADCKNVKKGSAQEPFAKAVMGQQRQCTCYLWVLFVSVVGDEVCRNLSYTPPGGNT